MKLSVYWSYSLSHQMRNIIEVYIYIYTHIYLYRLAQKGSVLNFRRYHITLSTSDVNWVSERRELGSNNNFESSQVYHLLCFIIKLLKILLNLIYKVKLILIQMYFNFSRAVYQLTLICQNIKIFKFIHLYWI